MVSQLEYVMDLAERAKMDRSLDTGDKIRRLQSLAIKGSLNNEAAADSFKDAPVYILIGLVLYEQAQRIGWDKLRQPLSTTLKPTKA